MKRVVFRKVARGEFDAAVEWYEGQRPGLGLEFLEAVDGILNRLALQPEVFRCVRGAVRRAIVPRFPYTVHFLNEPEWIVVLAVFHASRNPRLLDWRR